MVNAITKIPTKTPDDFASWNVATILIGYLNFKILKVLRFKLLLCTLGKCADVRMKNSKNVEAVVKKYAVMRQESVVVEEGAFVNEAVFANKVIREEETTTTFDVLLIASVHLSKPIGNAQIARNR